MALLPRMLFIRGRLDFRRASEAIFLLFLSTAVICVTYNLLVLHLVDEKPGVWANLSTVALPTVDFVASIVPSVNAFSKNLEHAAGGIGAELAKHIYSINWAVIGFGAVIALIPFIRVLTMIWQQPISMKRVPLRGYNHKRATVKYAQHLSKIYAAFSSITGIGIILLFGSHNLDQIIAIAGQAPTYRSLELHRVAVMASMGVALMFWSALWLVFYFRVRRKGLDQVKWRE